METAKGEYKRMKKMAPDVMRLLDLKKQLARTGTQQDPSTYLSEKFRQGRVAVDVKPGPSLKLEGWVERPFGVKFPKSRTDPLDRLVIVDTMTRIERERPDLKSKNLKLMFSGNDLRDAVIQFALYTRE